MRKFMLLTLCVGVFGVGWIAYKHVADSDRAQNKLTVAGDVKVPSIDINAMQVASSGDSQTGIDAKPVLKPESRTLYVWVAGTKDEYKHAPGAPKSATEEPIDINAMRIEKQEDFHFSSGGEPVMWSSGDHPPTAVFKAVGEK
jgi:hypothetical protein